MKAYYRPSDLTIVSAAREGSFDPELLAVHLKTVGRTAKETGVKHLFVDLGSDPPLADVYPGSSMVHVESDYWSEAKAKNAAIDRVDTPLVAFTTTDTMVYPETIQMTIELVETLVMFVLQGYCWEVPRDLTRRILTGECDPCRESHVIKNLSVPRFGPQLPGPEWQVSTVEYAKKVGGFSEDMVRAGGFEIDFHDRMYALTRREILTRDVPIMHLFNRSSGQTQDTSEPRRDRLMKFLHSGKAGDLDWRNT